MTPGILATPPPWAPAHGYHGTDPHGPQNIPEPGTPMLLSFTLLFLLVRRRR